MEWPYGLGQEHVKIVAVFNAPVGWKDDPSFVYIGMPGYAGFPKDDVDQAPFGKPWECLRDPRGWQEAFKEYLVKRLIEDPIFAGAVAALHGKTLVCFCKGSKRGPEAACHGDLLALMAERAYHAIEEGTPA